MTAEVCPDAGLGVTEDAFLGGAVRIRQPASGYRAGIDAVLLAASLPETAGGPASVLDLGAGAGTVGICAARRLPSIEVVLLEREPRLVRLAEVNIAGNGLAGRVRAVEADLVRLSAAGFDALGLTSESFNHLLANPPFRAEGRGTPSSEPLKASAHAMAPGDLERWSRVMARMTRSGGTATVIHLAEALPEVLAVMGGRFGELRLLPVHARAHERAIRIIVQGKKGSRGPMSMCPPLVLHEPGGGLSRSAVSILAEGAPLLI